MTGPLGVGTKDLLVARGLTKYFSARSSPLAFDKRAPIRAVDGVSFGIRSGETLGLVGESGCGKTTIARLLLMIEEPTHGTIFFRGRDIKRFTRSERRQYRSSTQAVFQDPMSSLNPRMRVEAIIAEPFEASRRATKAERARRVGQLLEDVGLAPSAGRRFPHEFSGGQRQRIAIARALAPHPKLIVLDEPVSALDVSIRAQIMNLLKDLQKSHGVSYLLVAHSLATVRFLADRVAVMYLGKIVETGNSRELFDHPVHPYTKALVSASLPSTFDVNSEQIVLTGEVPSPASPPSGCRFHSRCWLRRELGDPDRCVVEEPVLRPVLGQEVACHFAEELLVEGRSQ